MRFDVLTIFPHILDGYFNESILGRAQKKRLITIKTHNLRDVVFDPHKKIDDRPYGGGPGMILKVEPIYKTLKKIKQFRKNKIILFDPSGKFFDQTIADKFSKLDQLIFICGRYEGVDARVEKFIDEKISIGHYVLSGGELAAAVVIEAVSRLLPGVLGNQESLDEETFSIKNRVQLAKEYSQYTRPEVFEHKQKNKVKKLRVPKILLSGNHEAINRWRQDK